MLAYILNFQGLDDDRGMLFPFFSNQRKKFVEAFGPTRGLKPFLIKYQSYGREITIALNSDKKVDLSIDELSFNGLKELLLTAHKFNASKRNGDMPTSTVERLLEEQRQQEFRKNLESKLNAFFRSGYSEAVYIPAGRTFLTVLTEQLRGIGDSGIDLVNRQFIELIANLRPLFKDELSNVAQDWLLRSDLDVDNDLLREAESLIEAILKGSYRFTSGVETIVQKDDPETEVRINFASSGQQESVWILFILYFLTLSKSESFCVVEEPEAHLFPATQKDVVKLISLFSNASRNQVVITTHSPYILEAFNIAMVAQDAGLVNPDAATEVLSRSCWLDYEQCAAFMVANGTVEPILEDDLRQVNSLAVDSISDVFSEQYDRLNSILNWM